jgi:hypothetical protein
MERRMPRFFERGDPAEREQRDLEAKLKGAVDRCVDNAVRLQTAETKLTEACTLVEQLALEADEAALDRALQAKRGAEDKLSALRGAALKIGKEVSDIEAAIDKVVDQRVRHETAQAVDAMSARLSKAASAFDEAAKELEAAAREILIIPEAAAVAEFTKSMHVQIPVAVEMIVGALRQHARAVVEGHAPPSLPRPAAPPPALALVPPPETQNIFLLRNVKFIDATGSVITAGKYKRADLPKKLAELALSSGAALPISDKRNRDLEQMASSFQPDETSCEWIGARGPEAPVRRARPGGPVVHSQFEPLDRGGPFKATFSRPAEPEPMPLAASVRKMPDGE